SRLNAYRVFRSMGSSESPAVVQPPFALSASSVSQRPPVPIYGAVAALIIAGFTLRFAGDGLLVSFTPDDLMNLYLAWFRPIAEAERPVGALFYRGVFALFGLNPLPYRIFCFLLLFANCVLLYRFCVRLSGSREIGATACLIGAYHAHLADLYYST